MTDERPKTLQEHAARFGLSLPDEAAARLVTYVEALLKKNEEINLTGAATVDEALLRHVVDSLAFAVHANAERVPPKRVLDFGTGGGFPGVPIAVAFPATEVILLDGTKKKLDAVAALCAATGVANIVPTWARAEDLIRERSRSLLGACDAVVARAVGPLEGLVVRGGPFVRHGGVLVCWKSETMPDAERQAAGSVAKHAGLERIPDLPYVSDRPSMLVRYRRVR